MLIPEEWGGAGMDTVSYALMLEEVARVYASTAVALSVTNSVVGHAAVEARDGRAEREISAAAGARGNAGCVLPDGAGGGSDAARMQTRAAREATVTSERHEELGDQRRRLRAFILCLRGRTGAGARGITAFLVEPALPGFRISRYEDKMGLRFSRSAEIVFEDCLVPAENRLGGEGQGLKIALESLDGGRVGMRAQAVGVAQGAIEAAVQYAKQRRTFGKTIAEFQAIQWMLADMQTEIEAARALTHQAACARPGSARTRTASGAGVALAARVARETVRYRDGEPRGVQGGAGAREHGLFAGDGCGAVLPRRAGADDL